MQTTEDTTLKAGAVGYVGNLGNLAREKLTLVVRQMPET